jgi:acyl-CoA thioesterase-1
MSDPMLDKLIRFQRPERLLPYARHLSDTTIAAILGTEHATYVDTLTRLNVQLSDAVGELAADPDVAARLQRVPFTRGHKLVAIGESTTADRLSWFEILSALLSSTRPELELAFDNVAISGATTTQTLTTLPGLRHQRPDWVFCLLGTNDVQRFGSATGPRLVSQPETMRNLHELRNLTHLPRRSSWVWLTPTPVDELRVSAYPHFTRAGLVWRNRDIDEVATALHHVDEPVIDTGAAFSGLDVHLDDGLHPTLATQRALAAHVLTRLTS